RSSAGGRLPTSALRTSISVRNGAIAVSTSQRTCSWIAGARPLISARSCAVSAGPDGRAFVVGSAKLAVSFLSLWAKLLGDEDSLPRSSRLARVLYPHLSDPEDQPAHD